MKNIFYIRIVHLKKLLQMVLGFKKTFNGKPTNFKERIISGHKIHTIRNGSRWKLHAIIHMAYGVRTKQYDCFRISWVKAIQRIDITYKGPDHAIIYIDQKLFYSKNYKQEYNRPGFEQLVRNDGFPNVEAFWSWFGTEPIRNGQLIIWKENFTY